MAISFDERRRRMVPRWRDSRSPSGEELVTVGPGRDFFQPELFDHLHHDWLAEGTLETASEFVGAALVNGHTQDARGAAEFILANAPSESGTVRLLANVLLNGPRVPDEPEEDPSSTAYAKIAALKRRARQDPRNALAWTDLAREYTIIGQSDHALPAMRNAIALARDNRFVLRAASALFIHAGDGERAMHLLRKAGGLNTDPWLMAAEIAASQVAERRPASIKVGQRLIASQGLPPSQVSELAGSLATEEMNAGAGRAAKKLFALALVDPTENTVAQAEWASSDLRGIPLEPRHLLVPHSFEARALDARAHSKWRRALEESWRWLLDQPFSRAPALFGSYLAGIALDDQKEAIRIARFGLVANPGDRLLRNNLVVSLALDGSLAEAQREYDAIAPEKADAALRATLDATAGLLAYRSGRAGMGREHYERALEMLRSPRVERMRAVAALHLAREELRSGGDRGLEYVQRATKLAASSDAPEVVSFGAKLRAQAMVRGIMS
jgi:tetratricopeptide (TPR) repeat protein